MSDYPHHRHSSVRIPSSPLLSSPLHSIRHSLIPLIYALHIPSITGDIRASRPIVSPLAPILTRSNSAAASALARGAKANAPVRPPGKLDMGSFIRMLTHRAELGEEYTVQQAIKQFGLEERFLGRVAEGVIDPSLSDPHKSSDPHKQAAESAGATASASTAAASAATSGGAGFTQHHQHQHQHQRQQQQAPRTYVGANMMTPPEDSTSSSSSPPSSSSSSLSSSSSSSTTSTTSSSSSTPARGPMILSGGYEFAAELAPGEPKGQAGSQDKTQMSAEGSNSNNSSSSSSNSSSSSSSKSSSSSNGDDDSKTTASSTPTSTLSTSPTGISLDRTVSAVFAHIAVPMVFELSHLEGNSRGPHATHVSRVPASARANATLLGLQAFQRLGSMGRENKEKKENAAAAEAEAAGTADMARAVGGGGGGGGVMQPPSPLRRSPEGEEAAREAEAKEMMLKQYDEAMKHQEKMKGMTESEMIRYQQAEFLKRQEAAMGPYRHSPRSLQAVQMMRSSHETIQQQQRGLGQGQGQGQGVVGGQSKMLRGPPSVRNLPKVSFLRED